MGATGHDPGAEVLPGPLSHVEVAQILEYLVKIAEEGREVRPRCLVGVGSVVESRAGGFNVAIAER